MEWWIKVFRKFTDRWRYSDINTKTLFLHFLLIANHKPHNYKWLLIGAGECIVWRKQLSKILGLTEQEIKTAIMHLKSTNEITSKTTNKFTVITLVKWEEYQHEEIKSTSKSTSKSTNHQPTNNQQTTTLEEWKKERIKEDNNTIVSASPKKYWDPRINEILEIIKMSNNGLCDWTDSEKRNYWFLLMKKLQEIDSVKNWNYSAPKYLEILLWVVSLNNYHSHKTVWPKKIYYELAWLIKIAQQEIWKSNEKKSKEVIEF